MSSGVASWPTNLSSSYGEKAGWSVRGDGRKEQRTRNSPKKHIFGQNRQGVRDGGETRTNAIVENE